MTVGLTAKGNQQAGDQGESQHNRAADNRQGRRFGQALIVALLTLGAWPAFAQGTLAPVPQQVFLDASGNPLNNGKICTYAAGTTTPQATYYNQDLDVSHVNANPVRTNSAGRPTTGGIYLSPTSYKIVVLSAGTDGTCATGTTVYTQDNVSAVPATAVGLDVTGTAGETIVTGNVVYLSDGSGALNAGRWYKAASGNTYSSSAALQTGIATAGSTAGSSISVRVGGRMTGLSGLTLGTRYYVDAAAGLTSTAPANQRFVGAADTTTSLIVSDSRVPTGYAIGDLLYADTTGSLKRLADVTAGALLSSGGANAPPTWSTVPVDISMVQGRLTATTLTPITTGDVSAATSLFFTPYKGNRIALYDGSANWNARTFSEITISVTTCTANKPYDVFLFDNAGTVNAEILVWTSTTARATALVLQDGVLVKTGALTRRYVGSFYCNASGGQTDDTAAKRYVWNYYNRVQRVLRVIDSTATWTYTLAAFRQANGSTANQLDVMVGWAEVMINATLNVTSANSGANNTRRIGFGEDSTTVAMSTDLKNEFDAGSTAATSYLSVAELRHYPAVGRHFYAWLEYSAASGTTTWYGVRSASTADSSGMIGYIEG